MASGDVGCAFLSWDDWPVTSQDYDLLLVDASTGHLVGAGFNSVGIASAGGAGRAGDELEVRAAQLFVAVTITYSASHTPVAAPSARWSLRARKAAKSRSRSAVRWGSPARAR